MQWNLGNLKSKISAEVRAIDYFEVIHVGRYKQWRKNIFLTIRVFFAKVEPADAPKYVMKFIHLGKDKPEPFGS